MSFSLMSSLFSDRIRKNYRIVNQITNFFEVLYWWEYSSELCVVYEKTYSFSKLFQLFRIANDDQMCINETNHGQFLQPWILCRIEYGLFSGHMITLKCISCRKKYYINFSLNNLPNYQHGTYKLLYENYDRECFSFVKINQNE